MKSRLATVRFAVSYYFHRPLFFRDFLTTPVFFFLSGKNVNLSPTFVATFRNNWSRIASKVGEVPGSYEFTSDTRRTPPQ